MKHFSNTIVNSVKMQLIVLDGSIISSDIDRIRIPADFVILENVRLLSKESIWYLIAMRLVNYSPGLDPLGVAQCSNKDLEKTDWAHW